MDHAAALMNENAAFAELLRDADLSTPVPTCPGWSLDHLLRHLGRGDRWSAQIVAERAGDVVDPKTVPGGKPPQPRDDQITWLRDGVRMVLAAVEKSGRETVVHRADAALALGVRFDLDPALAADGLTEYLERTVIRANAEGPAGGDRPLGDGTSVHLHATDPGLGEAGEWTVLGRPDGIAVDHDHGRSTVALRGPARDLLLATVRRADADSLGLEVFGDRSVWETWLARTPF